MNRVLALASRELVERKLLFLGAALVGVMTLLFPLAPLPGVYDYREVVDVSAYVFALLLVVGGGIVLGATTIGRDLSSGRIAFFFTRELRSTDIWAGRLLGMFATIVLAAVVVLLPATLIGGGLRHLWDARAESGMADAAIVVLLLPLAAHYVSVALRSRSAWLALDVVALCASAAFLWTLSLPFLPYWLAKPTAVGVTLSLLALLLAIAGWVGLAKGRITPVAVHRWSALTLWSLVAVGLLSFAGWRLWVFAVSPHETDMSKGWASEFDGNGEWLGIGSGEEKGRGGIPHEFLISAKTGAWMRVDDASSVAVAADRRIAVIAKRSWAWRPPRWFETTVQVVDLTKSELKARDTGIVFGEGLWEAPAVAADGSRIAIRSAANVSVYSLPDEKLLAAFPLESAGWAGVRFIDADTLEMLSSEEDVTRIVRFDIGRRARISRIELPGGRFRLDSAGSRVAVAAHRSKNGRLMTIHDTRSGSKIAELPFKSSILGRRLCWLDRGEVALATLDDSPGGADVADGEPPRVTVHAADGSERLRVPFPGARRLQIVGEQRAGQLLVVWSDSSEYKEPCSGDTRLVAIDLATGAVAELPFDGWPKAYSWRMSPVRGSVTTRLFTACDGNMVLYDVATGEKRALLGQW